MMSSGKNVLVYEGCNYLRQRLVLSILSGKAIRIKKIRHKDENPGLRGLLSYTYETCTICMCLQQFVNVRRKHYYAQWP